MDDCLVGLDGLLQDVVGAIISMDTDLATASCEDEHLVGNFTKPDVEPMVNLLNLCICQAIEPENSQISTCTSYSQQCLILRSAETHIIIHCCIQNLLELVIWRSMESDVPILMPSDYQSIHEFHPQYKGARCDFVDLLVSSIELLKHIDICGWSDQELIFIFDEGKIFSL